MTVAVREATAAADARVEAWLEQQADATIFHTPRWGRAVERGAGQRFAPLLAEESGAVTGWLPLTHVRSWLFGDALVSSGFAVGGGMIGDHRALDALGDAVVTQARALRARGVELRGGHLPSEFTADDATNVGFVRALAETREAELAAIPRKHRAEVRKGLAAKLTVATGRDERQRLEHYRCYATSVRNLGTPVFPRSLFDAVLDAFPDADILTVSLDGEPLASVLSLYWRGAVMPYWGGGTRQARGLRANERMYFELMDHARARGCTRFDFGRSKAGSGPAAYKRNWGFDPAPLTYGQWASDGAPRDVSAQSPRYQMMVRTWRKLPIGLANSVGPAIARQLA